MDTSFCGHYNESGFVNDTLDNARFKSPCDIVVSMDGSILVADYGNNRIRKVHLQNGGNKETIWKMKRKGGRESETKNSKCHEGQVETLAGTGQKGTVDCGEGGALTTAQFAW